MADMHHAKIISQKRVFDGYHALDIIEVEPKSLRHEGYAGKIEREVYRGPLIAMVLLYIPETDEILLNQQFRMAPFIHGDSQPFLFECAAGAVDDGETPEEAARRECLEETGCVVDDLIFIGNYYTSAGCFDEKYYTYIGRADRAVAGHYGEAHEGEEIKTHLLPASKVFEMLDTNQITNGMSAMALHWFARHRDGLRKKWLPE